jgi:SagB-type dehydrogenase family enzyme
MSRNRDFLKSPWGKNIHLSDQQMGKEYPPLEKPFSVDDILIELISPNNFSIGREHLVEIIKTRKSRRNFSEEPFSLEELSFLLWATQGVHRIIGKGYCTIRTVPSAGARHPFETYVIIKNVKSINPGIYRYLALNHQLSRVSDSPTPVKLTEACAGQGWVTKASIVFVWAVIPYRTEWRYTEIKSPKIIALDAGHVCQNLYLACEAIGAGTCAIGAYNQKKMDSLIGVDGKEEFVVYLAPAGRISRKSY